MTLHLLLLRSTLLLLFLVVPPVTSFASWLECYVDLDESEIIMNFPVAAASSVQDGPFLVARALDTENENEKKENDDSNQQQPPLQGYPGQTFEIQFQQGSSVLDDVQYVLETTDGGQFVSEPLVCEGRRTHGRYQKHDTDANTALWTLSDEASTGTQVRVWAGWAHGNDVVTLTQPLRFQVVAKQEDASQQEQEL